MLNSRNTAFKQLTAKHYFNQKQCNVKINLNIIYVKLEHCSLFRPHSLLAVHAAHSADISIPSLCLMVPSDRNCLRL